MKQEDFLYLQDKAQKIIGARGISFGRVAAMPWVNFAFGKTEFALHLQCSFRVRDNFDILVTNNEMFEPSDLAFNKADYSDDTFDWDIQGNNRYDEWVTGLSDSLLQDLSVLDVKVSKYGDLTVLLNHGIGIDVFVNSATDECWRLFEIHSEEHLVITGYGLDKDE